jgi:hypothetical protein
MAMASMRPPIAAPTYVITDRLPAEGEGEGDKEGEDVREREIKRGRERM